MPARKPAGGTDQWRLSISRTLVALMLALVSHRVVAQQPTLVPDSAISAAERAMQQWFALLAHGDYGASWDQAAGYFREHVSREQWSVNASRLDRQFRRGDQRKLVEARWLHDEPPLPRAEYVVLRWLTTLDEGRQVGERIIVSHEPDGSWRPATYDLFPNVDGEPIVVERRLPPAPPPAPPRTIAPPRKTIPPGNR